MEDNFNPELESFRRQWREEVSARAKAQQGTHVKSHHAPNPAVSEQNRGLPPQHSATELNEEEEEEDEAEEAAPPTHGAPATSQDQSSGGLENRMQSLDLSSKDDDIFLREPQPQPTSALEHFEEAVKNEAQGRLGASLDLYRKAYKVKEKRG